MKETNEKMEMIAIKDFAKKIICDGHLYLCSKEGRRFYLMKPGILIDQEFVKKHASTQTVFDYSPVTDHEVIARFSNLFKELHYLQYEKDLRMKVGEIVLQFKETFTQPVHFLNFALACYQEFCVLPEEDIRRIHETDLHLFRKSLYSAAFAVIISFANDFYHYPMIKDFYNLSLSLDIGLCDPHYSYFVAEACNKENQIPGSGRQWMASEGATELESRVFVMHPDRTYQFLKEKADFLAFPELAEIALYQHELSNGDGFPRGIPKGHVSSWEAVVILADSLVEIRDEYEFECDVLNYLFSFQSKKLTDLPIQRVYKKLILALGDIYKVKGEMG